MNNPRSLGFCQSLLLFVSCSLAYANNAYRPCKGLVLSHKISPKLSSNEKAFVCSDPSQPGWKDIPTSQRKFHMIRILQERGYNNPSFSIRGQTLVVSPGPKNTVTKIKYSFSPRKVIIPKRRNWIGKKITPKLLDEIENLTAAELYQLGFPCAGAAAKVPNPKSGIVYVNVTLGSASYLKFRKINLHPSVRKYYSSALMSRYYAFVQDQPFSEDVLALTSQRLEASGLFESAYFIPACKSGRLSKLTLRGTVGLPRLFKVGIGIDTEGILKGRVSWIHNRLWKNASSFNITATASKLLQELSSSMKWYPFAPASRYHLQPSVSLKRRSEKHFENYSIKASFHPATHFEMENSQIQVALGPSVDRQKTVRGPDKGDLLIPLLEGRISYISHRYEKGIANPMDGTLLQLSTSFTDRELFSDVSALQLQSQLKILWNLGNRLPPVSILGIRLNAATTLHQDGPLPPNFRYYLGGKNNLRGFSRLELPANGEGAKTSLYLGVENRFPSILPWKLEPFLFVDVGMLGSDSFEVSESICGSPGLGIRWNSPIGVVRGTIAHGFVAGTPDDSIHPPTHWQLYLGYGEEF